MATQKAKFKWTEELELQYIDCLLDAVKQGKRTDTGWKPIVTSEVMAIFRSKGFPAVSKAQLDTKRDAVCPQSIGQDLF
jgi:hypothetical protein